MKNIDEYIAEICDALEEAKNKPVEMEIPTPLSTSVGDDLTEWSELITQLCLKEVDYIKIKDRIFDKQQWMEENTDFKEMYGKNNADVRKAHFKKFLKDEYAIRNHLEISIDYCKRRISFLKQLVHTKTVIMEVKE